MFDIGFWEILVITLVALLVVGPERLPGLARELGRFVGKARRFVNSVRSDIEQELQTEELRKMLKNQENEIEQLKTIMRDTEGQLRGEIESASEPLRQDIEETQQSLRDVTEARVGDEAQKLPEVPDPKQAWDRPSVVPRVPVRGLLGENLQTEHPPTVQGDVPAAVPEDQGPADPLNSQPAFRGESASPVKPESPTGSMLPEHADYRSDAAQWGDIETPASSVARGGETREKG